MWPNLNLGDDVREELLKMLVKSFDTRAESKLNAILKILSMPPRYTTLRCLHADDNLILLRDTINQREMKRSGCSFDVHRHFLMNDVIIAANTPSQPINVCDKEVIVDGHCGAAVLRGSNIFKPGIISITPDVRKGDQVSVFIDLQGKCLKGRVDSFQGHRLFIANGVSMVTRREVFAPQVEETSKSGVGIEIQGNVFHNAPTLDNLLPSIVFPQNLPSLVCVHVLSPQPGSLVLDMCAAPGGKTSHMASLVGEQGRVVALDKNKGKVARMKETLHLLTNVSAFPFDSTQSFHPEADDSLAPPFHEDFFDCILVDAPCSGLGQRPCFNHCLLNRNRLHSYPIIQKRILKNAIPMLKPGGAVVYSTCTINPEENEAVVAWVLNKFPNLILQKQTVHLGGCGWKVDGLSDDQLALLQRFDPSILIKNDQVGTLDDQNWNGEQMSEESQIYSKKHPELNEHLISPETDTIGFFIAKFIKK